VAVVREISPEVNQSMNATVGGLAVTFAVLFALAASPSCSHENKNGDRSAAKTAPLPPAATPPAAPTPSEGPTAPAATAGKSRSETAEYIAEVTIPEAVAPGAEASLTVTVKPKAGWHFNLDFPTSVKTASTDGVAVRTPKQGLSDAVSSSEDAGAAWAVKVVPGTAGQATVTCDLKFAVCTETTCDPKRETLAVKLDAR
jgi:hypothetical protein